MNNIIINAIEIYKDYRTGDEILKVLKGLNLKVSKGEILMIVGDSGSGKTTLLNLLAGIDKVTSGKIYIDNLLINSLNDNQLSTFRNKTIGVLFQFHYLLSEFTALENVILPALINRSSYRVIEAKAKKLLNELGLQQRYYYKPAKLSGGEAQRVALARALINSPKIVLADEPTGNLDKNNALNVMELIFEINKKYNTTFIIVTHNEKLAKRADRVLRLEDGILKNAYSLKSNSRSDSRIH